MVAIEQAPAASSGPSCPPPRTFAQALAEGPLVLDGGLSNQLEARGNDLTDALWSARLLADAPEEIAAAHAAYFEAGAEVVITSSYQASFEGFAKRGIEREEASQLLRRSVELARAAASSADAWEADAGLPAKARFVAASIGPYGAVLADGSEYRGRYGLTVAELEKFHAPRLEALLAAEPDVLAIETIPDTDEARAILNLVRGTGIRCWLSFSSVGACTRAGQALSNAFGLAADVDEVLAVGVNCCAPEDVRAAMEIATAVTGKPVVAYPNSGEIWDAEARMWREAPSFDTTLVKTWANAGARLIGGCCRIGPESIAEVALAVREVRRQPRFGGRSAGAEPKRGGVGDDSVAGASGGAGGGGGGGAGEANAADDDGARPWQERSRGKLARPRAPRG